jgi:RND family efflux transporter MFP subunit
MRLRKLTFTALLAPALWGQAIEIAKVQSKALERTLRLPAELVAFQKVELRARVRGFIEEIRVDRGSLVKKGELLIRLSAPEMAAQVAAAEAKVATAQALRAEAEAKLLAAQSTYERLKKAAATPGAVAGNEVVQAEKAVEAARALLSAQESAVRASQAAVAPLRDMLGYLEITAPFDGVVTARRAHPGALAGPEADPLLEIEAVSRLRLVTPAPETEVGAIPLGATVAFTVPAYPAETFRGTVSRIAHSLDPKTRTMAVEADVANPGLRLAPGMFAEVQWPVRKSKASLLVPASAVVTTTERTFVIRVRNGQAEWVNVTKGSPAGDAIEVFGPLRAGDAIIKRASDEIREGTRVTAP